MALHTTAMEIITAYTGLSPTAFFTILALMCVVYKTVCGMFVDPEQQDFNTSTTTTNIKKPVAGASASGFASNPTPFPEPMQLGDLTEEELRAYDGSDPNPNKPLLMAIKGQVYDVSRSRMFYGHGGPYAKFAGRDASRALALMSFDPKDLTGNLEGLSDSELEVLQDWEYKFMEKYPKVGQLVTERAAKHIANGDKLRHSQNQDSSTDTQ